MDLIKWDLRFLSISEEISKSSKDPSTKVGSIIVDKDNRIVSTGFNGFPQYIEDTEERLNDRVLKNKYTLHAEANALLFAKKDLNNCTIYGFPFMPCSECAKMIIQSGIDRVVSFNTPEDKIERWKDSFDLSVNLFVEAGIELKLY